MQWDSPIVLTLAGTLAIHTILVVAADAVMVIREEPEWKPPPRLELVEVEVVKERLRPPPPPLPRERVEPPVDEVTRPRARVARPVARQTEQPPPPPAATPPPAGEPGGGPVVAMDDIAPSATGTVPVARGKRTTGHIGRGGTGDGTGAGAGSGSGETPAPMSVATIKTRAMPRGDQSYASLGKDYPPEARQLGIEGVIRVRLIVDATGKVASAVLINKLGHGLDEIALARARQIEFDPAKDTDDKPVTSVVVWTFHMTLPK